MASATTTYATITALPKGVYMCFGQIGINCTALSTTQIYIFAPSINCGSAASWNMQLINFFAPNSTAINSTQCCQVSGVIINSLATNNLYLTTQFTSTAPANFTFNVTNTYLTAVRIA
jgi:hypothetical protein